MPSFWLPISVDTARAFQTQTLKKAVWSISLLSWGVSLKVCSTTEFPLMFNRYWFSFIVVLFMYGIAYLFLWLLKTASWCLKIYYAWNFHCHITKHSKLTLTLIHTHRAKALRTERPFWLSKSHKLLDNMLFYG